MKYLIIAEKPSVAKDISRVLKCNKKGEGYFYNNNYIISWAIGHLIELFEPEDYDEKYKKWDSSYLPIIPDELKTKVLKKTNMQFKILKNLLNSKEIFEVICATDSGREGELIFRYIYNQAKCKKPFKRLWISSMTDEAIKEGFKNLKDGKEYDNLFFSAKCRSEADWLVGINATRIFTLKFNSLLSIGRVQTPTLAIIVERQKEIENFDEKQYFEIEANLKTENNQAFKSNWIDLKNNDTKIFNENKAKDILNNILNKDGEIYSFENNLKKQLPPLLYDLTELQRDCNKKYGYSAQKTLSLAQNLYEKRKLITYPRTDSRYLSDDMIPKLNLILKNIYDLEDYKKYLDYIFKLEKLPINNRIINNSKITDHHAIIPTNSKININNLSLEEKNVYNLIVRRFISVFYPEFVYNSIKIITKIENEFFISKGTVVIEKGYTILNIITEKDTKKEDILPNVKKGDKIYLKNAKILNKKTKPPSNYTEATLLSAMENAGRFVEDEEIKEQLKESGLGTPATRASIIERLIDVRYIERKGKNLIPTKKGINLINVAPKELTSPETTGKWEKALSSISKGNMKPEKFMASISRYVEFLVNYVENSNQNIVFENDKINSKKHTKYKELGNCPKCNGKVLENTKSFYCSNWKNDCNFSIWKDCLKNFNIKIESKIIKKLIKDNIVPNFKCNLQGNEIIGDIVLTQNFNVIFERKNNKV